jgi:hypothetical protein
MRQYFLLKTIKISFQIIDFFVIIPASEARPESVAYRNAVRFWTSQNDEFFHTDFRQDNDEFA